MKKILPPVLPLVIWLVFGEFLGRAGIIKTYILPLPSEVLASFWNDRIEFLSGTYQTAQSTLMGLMLSFVFGTVIAIVLSLFDFARRVFLPYALFFQTVPIIAIAPLLVIWFGFGMPTVVASAFIVSVFPIIANTLVGLKSTEPALLDLFRIYKSTKCQILFKLQIPFSLPYVFSGLKIATGLAVIGALVGEFVGGGGIGAIIDSSRTQQRIDKVFAAIFISALLGFALFEIIQFISNKVLSKWHPTERNT